MPGGISWGITTICSKAQGLEHGNTLGTSIVLTDLLKAELSRLLPKFVNIETTEPEVTGKKPRGCGYPLVSSNMENHGKSNKRSTIKIH